MKKTSLNKIKSNKVYKDLNIISVNTKSTTDILKNDCILVLSDNVETYIKVLNMNLFKYSYYKYIFSPVRYRNIVKGTYERINLKEYYKEILSKTEKNRLYKKNIYAYKGYNIIIDSHNQLQTLYKTVKTKSINSKLDLFISNITENLVSMVTKNYHKNMVILVPIELSSNLSSMGINKYLNPANVKDEAIQYMYNILRRENLVESFKTKLKEKGIDDLTFLFTNTTLGLSFKVTLNELNEKKTNLNKTVMVLKRLFTSTLKGDTSDLEIENQNESSEDKETLNTIEVDTLVEKKIKKTEQVVNSIVALVKTDKNLTPDTIKNMKPQDFLNSNLSDKESELVNGMINAVTKVVNNDSSLTEDENEERLINTLQSNLEFMEYLKKLKDIQTLGNSNVDLKKIEVLQNTQDNIEVEIGGLKTADNKPVTLGSILNSNNDISIKKKEIPVKNRVLFENVKENKTKDFDKSYMENMYDKDILRTFSAFNNDPELPMFIDKFNVENTSDDLTLKQTYTVKYKDAKGVRHNVVIDIPIIIDDKYIFINGSKKLIQKQLIAKPIIKTAPDKVQITSDYNKYFITRFGQKLSEETDVLRKVFTNQDISKYIKNDKNFNFKLGDTSEINMGANISIYYSYLSSILFALHTDKFVIEFDYYKLLNLTEKENNILYDNKLASIASYDKSSYHIVGYTKDKNCLLIVDKGSNKVYLYNNTLTKEIAPNLNQFIINQCIIPNFTPEGIKYLNETSRPKSLVYNRVKISSRNIPLIILLGYEYGLLNVLDRYKVDYVFTSKNRRTDLSKDMTMKIPFKNGILYYDNLHVKNSLLVSGLTTVNTKEYNINEFEMKGEAYLDYFQDTFGSRNTAKGLSNNLSLFIDPKTRDILKRLHLPENILDLMLYGNTLLENNAYNNSNNMANFRLRGVEQVNAILYKILADAYKKYKDTSKNGNPIKVSVPQNILLKKIVENQTVDEASDLNPSLEIEKASSVTYKGVGGVNSSDAYNEQFRAYDKSMLGILGMETPDSDKVGIVRTLSYSPAIVNTLGFLDEEADKNGNTNIYTIAELLNNFTATNADPPRIGMQSTQQKHILSVEDSDKPLFGSGVEKTIPYMLSDVYTFKAKKNGTITKIDKENNLALITYEDGSKDVINLNNKVNKNSNGGLDG